MKNKDLKIMFNGRGLWLLPEKACYDIKSRSLIVTDVHIGKETSMSRQGLPAPKGVSIFDLNRIIQIWQRLKFSNLYILGDFIHDDQSLAEGLGVTVSEWLKSNSFETTLILGNHDRHLNGVEKSWSMRVVKEFWLGGLRLSHEHDGKDFPTMAGHEHPFIILKNGYDRLRLPCFYIRENQMTIPAFGSLTGGFEISLHDQDQIYAVGDESVIKVGSKSLI